MMNDWCVWEKKVNKNQRGFFFVWITWITVNGKPKESGVGRWWKYRCWSNREQERRNEDDEIKWTVSFTCTIKWNVTAVITERGFRPLVINWGDNAKYLFILTRKHKIQKKKNLLASAFKSIDYWKQPKTGTGS